VKIGRHLEHDGMFLTDIGQSLFCTTLYNLQWRTVVVRLRLRIPTREKLSRKK